MFYRVSAKYPTYNEGRYWQFNFLAVSIDVNVLLYNLLSNGQ